MSDTAPIPDDDPDVKRVSEAVTALSEHFDAVHIFVTKYETTSEAKDGRYGTTLLTEGIGNYHARYGAILEWVIRQEERFRSKERE